MNTILKPCPFCGGQPVIDSTAVSEGAHEWQTTWISCIGCNATMEDDRCVCHHPNKYNELIEKWNNRC